MKTLILFLCIASPIFSIGQKSFSLENQKVTQTSGRLLKTDVLIDPIHLQLFDSLILIHNNQTKYHYDILDLKSGRIVSSFSRKGRGPGEVIFPKNFQILPEKDKILVYDLNQKKVNFYQLSKVLDNKLDNYLNSFRIDSAYAKRVFLLDDETYLCPLIGDKVGYKYFRLNKDETFNGFYSLLPDVGKPYPTIISANLFNYWSVTNDLRNKIVMAYDHWDKIDIITNVQTGKELTILGPRHKIPEFKASQTNLALTRKSIYAYCSPCAGNNSFMVLYLGTNVYDKNTSARTQRNYTKALHFDYEGNLLEVIELNPGAQYITVDWKKNIIYGVNKELEPTLYEYKY